MTERDGEAKAPGILAFVAFLSGAVLLRFHTFSSSVLDWDESLYLLMGRAILRGEVPYVTVWDHKPPGIYLILALSQIAFGHSILAIRLISCLTVAVTCFLLVRFGAAAFGRRDVGWIAGVFYLLFSTANGGLAANTEIFFAPFVVLAFHLLLTRAGLSGDLQPWRKSTLLVIGLSMGLAFQIKYVTVFELMAIVLLMAIGAGAPARAGLLSRFLAPALLVLAGAALPFAVVAFYFAVKGHLAEYMYANFTANIIHSRTVTFSLISVVHEMRGQVKVNLPLWCSLFLAFPFFATFRRTHPHCRTVLGVLGIWIISAFFGVGFTRQFYPHSFLQPLSPLCLLSAYMMLNTVTWSGIADAGHRKLLLAFVLIPGMFLPLYDSTRATFQPLWEPEQDVPRQVAAYLNERLEPGSTFYVADYEPVLYYLVDVRMPTRYVFPQFLTMEHFARMAGVDPLRELDSIMMNQRPQFVVLAEKPHAGAFYAKLDDFLQQEYISEVHFDGVEVFRRSASSP